MIRSIALIVITLLAACRGEKPSASPPATKNAPEPAQVTVSKERQDLLFTYVDPTGRYHDATRIDDVPADSRAQVLVRDLSKTPDELHSADFLYVADLREAGPDGRYPCGVVSRFAFERGGVREAAREAAKGAEARGEKLVIVYSAAWCGVCKKAKGWLHAKGVPFIERDVEKDPGASDELAGKAAAAGLNPGGVPVIDVAGELLIGFDASALERALRRQGLWTAP